MKSGSETMILGDGTVCRVISRELISRSPLDMTDAEIIACHKENRPVPKIEFTVVRVE